MTPKQQAQILFINFDMIIYTSHDYKSQVVSCMKNYIKGMINENKINDNEKRVVYWCEVLKETDKLK